MKKNRAQDQEQKPRRLTLNRETIQALDDPTLLELVRGGTSRCHALTTSGDTQVC